MRGPDYWTTDDDDPRRLCHDVLVAIDETRRLNNGQPSLWASLFDQLDLQPDARVIHVGAGMGYYSAILATIVGPAGKVTALEIDPGLAPRARDNLAAWPQVGVIAADGFAYRAEEPADAIVVNAGVTSFAGLARFACGEGPAFGSAHQCEMVGRFPDDHARRWALPGSLCIANRHHSLRQRPGPGFRSAFGSSAGRLRLHRDPVAPPLSGRARRFLLARRRRLVAFDGFGLTG